MPIGRFFCFCLVWFLLTALDWRPQSDANANQKKSPASPLKATIQEVVDERLGQIFSDRFAIETGIIEDGKQIPLPKFKDGAPAKRENCKYFVSPATVNTVLFGWAATEGYYLVCQVDSAGFVRCHLAKYVKDTLVKVGDFNNQYHTIFFANYLVFASRD